MGATTPSGSNASRVSPIVSPFHWLADRSAGLPFGWRTQIVAQVPRILR